MLKKSDPFDPPPEGPRRLELTLAKTVKPPAPPTAEQLVLLVGDDASEILVLRGRDLPAEVVRLVHVADEDWDMFDKAGQRVGPCDDDALYGTLRQAVWCLAETELADNMAEWRLLEAQLNAFGLYDERKYATEAEWWEVTLTEEFIDHQWSESGEDDGFIRDSQGDPLRDSRGPGDACVIDQMEDIYMDTDAMDELLQWARRRGVRLVDRKGQEWTWRMLVAQQQKLSMSALQEELYEYERGSGDISEEWLADMKKRYAPLLKLRKSTAKKNKRSKP